MTYLIHILYGVFIAYFAMISPGMLNMTALKVRLDFGKLDSFNFALGAAIVIFIQSGIALFFADYFSSNPQIIEFFKVAGVFVFFMLSYYFFRMSRKKEKIKTDTKKGNFLLKGMVMSALNMLSIPFYLAITMYLASEDNIIIEQPYIILFVSGVFIGAMLLFYTYISFADVIVKKVAFIARNINLILSGLFAFLGIMTLVRLFA